MMTESEITYWSMIGTWFAGFAGIATVLVTLYLSISSRKTRLNVRLRKSYDGDYELTLLNQAHVHADIESINLSCRVRWNKRIAYSSRWGDDLVRHILDESDEQNESLKLFPNNVSKTLVIEAENLLNQYRYFLPYVNGILLKPVKMPKCQIQVKLVSGEVFYQKLPHEFYSFYRQYEGSKYDQKIYYLCNEPEKFFNYESSDELFNLQQDCLKNYAIARMNYHLLLK